LQSTCTASTATSLLATKLPARMAAHPNLPRQAPPAFWPPDGPAWN
jgi:hypothetical protein